MGPVTLLTIAAVNVSPVIQQPPVRTLGAPTATLAEPFIEVTGVRELRDGRVVVLDMRDQSIHLGNFETGSATPIGRQGDGPGEYRLPLLLHALSGDSTGVNDMARPQGLFIVTPDGRAGGLLSTSGEPPGSARIITPHAVDRLGRYYLLNRPSLSPAAANPRATPPEATPIARVDPRTGAWDTIAHINGRVNRAHFRDAASPRPGPAPPFSTADQWTVAPDGRVAIVTVVPYRVTYIHPDGQTLVGPPLRVERLPLTAAHRAEWLEAFRRPRPRITSGSGGQVSYGFGRVPFADPTDWPTHLPPFVLPNQPHDATARFAPDGTLWIRRTTPAGAPQTYDLIDAMGRLAARLVLPARSRLVGFGASAVYLVQRDDDDLEYLQRYRLPAR
jgi:hypothetical protein